MKTITIQAEPIDKLSEGQRACLRLVYDHMTSKAIARELGISPHTVDQRIKVAMRALKVDSRVEAARILANHEETGAYPQLVYQVPDIAADSFASTNIFSANGSGTVGVSASRDGEEERAFKDTYALHGMAGGPASFPTHWAERRVLGAGQKIVWIIAIAIGSALAFGAILAGLDALTRLS